MSKLTTAAAVAAAINLASGQLSQAVTWDGGAGDLFWTSPTNWDANVLPTEFDDVIFGPTGANLIQLDGNQSINGITFAGPFTLGSYGTPNSLLSNSGQITVNTGVFATINASLAGSSGLNLSGGGSLYLGGIPSLTGNLTIDGAGTSLVASFGGPAPQANGTATVQINGRQNGHLLGISTVAQTITMQNGGEFKLIGPAANPDGSTRNFSFGGGALNLPAAYNQLTLDDAGQLGSFDNIILRGKGRLTTATQDYTLFNNLVMEGGIFEFTRLQSAGGAGTRFSVLSSTSTVTLNGGLYTPNSATQGRVDNAIVLNPGGTIGVQGADHIFGNDAAGPVVTWTLNGGKILLRDSFNPQQGRLPRIRTQLEGAGTVELVPGRGNGQNPRFVLERGDLPHTFSGTFVLPDNAILESNPRNGAGTVTLAGKTFGAATINLNGYLPILDLRDNATGSNLLLNSGASDYTANDLVVSGTQLGGRALITTVSGATVPNTNNFLNFDNLSIGSQRLQLDGANNYGLALNTLSISGTPFIDMNTGRLTILGAVTEAAAGQGVTFSKRGLGNSAATDITAAGSIGVSNLNVAFGSVILRGVGGAIGTGSGGAPTAITIHGGDTSGNTRGNPIFGSLHLDSNGTTVGVTAGNNINRISDTATVRMLGNSVLRLTSNQDNTTTETIGTLNLAGGHSLIDVVKSGTSPAPVGFTLNAVNQTNFGTANITGTTLGGTGNNSSRVVIPGTAAGFMGSTYHSGNEWAKYDPTVDSGTALGVVPFSAADYTQDNTEDFWAPGQHNKQTLGSVGMIANRTVATLNLQFTVANQFIDTGGNTLTLGSGGLLVSGTTTGIVGNFGTGGLTAGTTTPSTLHVYNASQLDIKLPITNNAGADGIVGNGDDQAVNFVKSGIGTVRLTHHLLGVGTGNQGGSVPPYTDPAWSSTMTGSWVINEGVLDVHRGQFLGGRPIILNGGTLNVNEPVDSSGVNSTLNNWNNNVTVNSNAVLGTDDNGESADAGVGGNTMPLFGSLTMNNGATLGLAAFNGDLAFMNGATFNGRATLNMGANRSNSVNHVFILNGAVTGAGFDVVTLTATQNTLMLGRNATDTVANTFTSPLAIYGGTVRLNKANGTVAIPDTAGPEDVVINGGTLAWGAGHVGDFNTLNNGIIGLVPTTPAGTLASGQDQIADAASVTLLTGTLGEGDRINNEKFGFLTQKNGTLNVGLGTLDIGVVNVSGGAFGINNGGTLKAGALNLESGSYSPNITTGLPGNPAAVTTLEIGAGGLSTSGQNIILGTGSSANFAGAGSVLKLGGNVTAVDDPLHANSWFQGIWMQLGNSFREHGNSRVDLMGGNRTFSVDGDVQYFVTAPITNGGITLTGGGTLVLEPFKSSDFAGSVVADNGVLIARGNGAFGTSAGGVTVNEDGTVKLESGWSYGDSFTIAGRGAIIPGSNSPIRELGALVSESGKNRILTTATFALAADATIASNAPTIPTASPAGGVFNLARSNFSIESQTGITGSGTLTLSGQGDGIILNGINTATGGLSKEGSGRWVIGGASTYTGPTSVFAGPLRVSNSAALGSSASGTTVYNGGSLELVGGVNVGEPLVLRGGGSNSVSGAIHSVSESNTLSGTIALASNATLRADGDLILAGATGISATGDRTLTLTGSGSGTVQGNIALNDGTFVKSGSGTWTLRGGNQYENTALIEGGTLILDYSVSNLSKLNQTAITNFAGGNLSILGSATAATTQTVGGINLQGGNATISVANGAGQNATLAIGAISRLDGGTVNFVLPAQGAITTSTPVANGILGGYATVGGQDWAAKSGANIVPLATYTPLLLETGADSSNAIITSAKALTGSITTNSLKIGGGLGLNLDVNSLTLTSGGLLYSGSGTAYLVGSGVVSGNTSADQLVIHTASGVLNSAASLIGADIGGLTKSGAGTLVLNGTSSYLGPINVNQGTLSIVGLGGTHPAGLGAQSGQRNIILNGATFNVAGDYDLNVSGGSQMQMVIGTAGGTIRTEFGGQFMMNDAGQFSGPGDLTLAGNGRFVIQNQNYSVFGGNVTVEGGLLQVNNINSLGGRAEQTVRLKANSILVNGLGSAVGIPGLPNNLILEGGAALHTTGGNRTYTGDVQLSGTNILAAVERDNPGQNRELHLTGRLTGTNITLNVVGNNNATPVYLSSGSNEITGTINLGVNATMEARIPGSLGVQTAGVTITMDHNSRLLLRHYQNGDFLANVVVNGNAELSSDRMVNYGGGGNQLLSINNLTVSDADILTFGGGNGFFTRIAGTATFNASPIVNAPSNAMFDNGISFGAGATDFDKRGAGTMELFGPSTQSGRTVINAGIVTLRGANGALPNTSTIDLRGGELRIDNSDALNANRVNDAANIVLAGGTLRVIGNEATITNGTISAPSGNSIVSFTQSSETVASSISLPGLAANRSRGATVQFQTDFGPFVGATTFGQARISSRILLPGQTDVPNGDIIPWAFGNNGLDFVSYDGTTVDSGVPRGVIEYRNTNSGTALNPTYTTDPTEANFNSTVVARLQGTNTAATTTTLTAARSLRAVKLESGDPGTTANTTNRRLDLNAQTLTIERGAIIIASQPFHLGNQNTSTNGVLTSGTNELIFIGNNTVQLGNTETKNGVNGLAGNVVIADGAAGPVSLVKSGTGSLQLRSLTATSSFTGGVYLNAGTLDVWRGENLGGTVNTLNLAGGTLNLNVPNAGTDVNFSGFGHNVAVSGNATINLDNNGETPGTGTDNNFVMGTLTVNGAYTLTMRGFDSQDISFNGVTLSSKPTIDLIQQNAAGNTTSVTLGGILAGDGFSVASSGNVANSAAALQIGGGVGDTAGNTYAGKVTLVASGSNNQPIVQLNKADGTTAITGDLEVNGGQLNFLAANQVDDDSVLELNAGTVDFNGKSDTIKSVAMRGGAFRTNSTGVAPANVVRVTGDFDVSGVGNFLTTDGVQVNTNSTLEIAGVLKLNGYSRGVVGASEAYLTVGGLEMTGTVITQNSGAGLNVIQLNGDVATLPATVPSNLGNSTDSDTFLNLNGIRSFDIADGPAAMDFQLSSVTRDNTAPFAVGGIVKNGAGTMQIQGGGTANSYTGATLINAGKVVLFKSVGVNALGSGPVTVGDGVGGAAVDQLIVRNSNQINDNSDLTIASSGVLDLETFNTNETVASIAGSGAVKLGPATTLTLSGATDTTFSGSITGGGTIAKVGTAIMELTGTSEYIGGTRVDGGTLIVTGAINGHTVTVNSGATLGGKGAIGGAVLVNAGGILAPGSLPGLLNTGDLTIGAGAAFQLALNPSGLGNIAQGLDAAGLVTLGGDLFLPSGFNPTGVEFVTLIANDGTDAVIGTFNGLAEGASLGVFNGFDVRISYLGNADGGAIANDVILQVPEPSAAGLIGAALAMSLGLKRSRRRS